MASEVIVTDNSDLVKKLMHDNIVTALYKVGIDTEKHAKENYTSFPRVDTGRLRGSIAFSVSIDEQTVNVGTNVEYASYVEMGTIKMHPSWCLKRSVTEHENEIRNTFQEAINSLTES